MRSAKVFGILLIAAIATTAFLYARRPTQTGTSVAKPGLVFRAQANQSDRSANGFENDADDPSARLRFGLKDSVTEFNVADLKRLAPEQTFEAAGTVLSDGERRRYRGFLFNDLLAKLSLPLPLGRYRVVIACKDGYRPVVDPALFARNRAFLAYRQIEISPQHRKSQDGLWALVKSDGVDMNPGPFYLVWDTATTYPDAWPFQISEIALVPSAQFEEYTRLAPTGAFDSKTEQGYQLFLSHCTNCHSIHGIGPLGRAPDLGAAAKTRSEEYILSNLRNGRGTMPSFADVFSASQMSAVLAYLKNVGAHP